MNRDQNLVVLAGLPVLTLTLGAYWGVDGGLITLPETWGADRVRLGACCAAVAGSCVLIAIQRIAMFRFVSDADRPGEGLAPAPGPSLRMYRAVLHNTLEQALIAALAYLAFATAAPARLLALLPAYAALFVIGRFAFALGYPFGAAGRALGFGLTMAPTVTLYVLLGLMLFQAF